MLTKEENDYLAESAKWDVKIGAIYISSSVTMEREWHIALPKNISFHVDRISLDDDDATEEKLIEMLESGQVEEAARHLASCEVDVIAFGCTAGSFIKGAGWDKALAGKISASSDGIPATTTSTGVLEALEVMGCSSINMATPYIDEISLKEKAFLEANGIEVRQWRGACKVKDQDIAKVTPEQFIDMHMDMYEKNPDVQALFISCTNSWTLETINILEKRLGIPVISSNQVTLWSALRKAGYKGSIPGYGKLLEKYL